MKKKFDIIEYIKCYIKMYDDGYYSKTDLIDNLSDTLYKGSWQMHCDGKEVTNNSVKGFDFDGNPQTYYVVSDWCRGGGLNMRIIKNGASKLQDIHQFKCQICGCVYELDLCDEEVSECPCCHAHKGYQVRFNDDTEEDVKTKTPDEVYPEKFYSFKDGLDKSDEEIRELIRETIEHYKQNNCGYSMCATGRVLVAVFQSDKDNIDDYQVIVTKDYSSLDSMELS